MDGVNAVGVPDDLNATNAPAAAPASCTANCGSDLADGSIFGLVLLAISLIGMYLLTYGSPCASPSVKAAESYAESTSTRVDDESLEKARVDES